jgi:gas vesicle protein
MKDVMFLILGAVFGAIFALLLAPQTGEDLRTKIQASAEEDWNKLQTEWQASLDKTHERLDKIQVDLQQALQHDEDGSA